MAKITDIKAIALEHDLGAEHAYGMARGMTAVRNMTLENGGDKLVHGSGGISQLRAA